MAGDNKMSVQAPKHSDDLQVATAHMYLLVSLWNHPNDKAKEVSLNEFETKDIDILKDGKMNWH